MKGRHLPILRARHQVGLLEGGQDLFPEMVRGIDACVREVRMETYIFNFDESGQKVAQALERAARRGVQVFLMVDGVGTPEMPSDWTQRFDAAGVQWRIFLPLGHVGLLIPSHWRRLHRKLCVIDGQVMFCGGINILDDWIDPNHGQLQSPRLDFAVRVSGPLVRLGHETATQLWLRQEAAHELRHADWSASWKTLQDAVRLAWEKSGRSILEQDELAPAGNGARAALVLRDNLRFRTQIERAYRKSIADARQNILIANAYFLPGRKLRRALIKAVQRGVRVRLLLQGRYEYFMQYHAVRMVYGQLLAAGIEIWEYRASFLHAKVAVIDCRWATVGSSNLDPLSLLLAREANIVLEDESFAEDLHERLSRAIETGARQVDPASYASRPWRERLLDRLAYGLMRLAVLISGSRY